MENKSHINEIMDSAINNLKKVIDVSTIVGEPIIIPGGTTIIPVSKVSFGLGTGGSDLPGTNGNTKFGGGSGAGATITPLAFLVITEAGGVNILHVAPSENTAERLVGMIPSIVDQAPGVIEKIKNIVSKKDEKGDEKNNTDVAF